MDLPEITRHPTEIFGYAFCNHSNDAEKALQEQYCPYINCECKKPRKSTPKVKIGSCSVGYKGDGLEVFKPIIICPYRFNSPAIFNTIEREYLSHWDNIEWVSEVSIDVGGSIDWVAINKDKHTGIISEFLCVEFQAAGTTGTPWDAIEDFKNDRTFHKSGYHYGINWANEFSKTMMQQVFKKGNIIEHWKKKILYIVQDVGLEYIKRATDTSGFRDKNAEDPIDFLAFELYWKEDRWDLRHVETLSTDLDGINKVLAGTHSEKYPTVQKFIKNIERKNQKNKSQMSLKLNFNLSSETLI